MTPAEAVTKAIRVWVEERRTGFLVLNFRHGVLKDLEHQIKEFPDPVKSAPAGRNGQPVCPSCGEALTSRDAGAMWTCEACRVKRTKAQLTKEAG